MQRHLKIAAAQYPLDNMASLDACEDKLNQWIGEAAEQGAQLLVFPEYGGLELAAIGGKAGDMMGCLDAVSELLPDVDAIHAKLAAKHGVFFVAGSAPQRRSDGRIY